MKELLAGSDDGEPVEGDSSEVQGVVDEEEGLEEGEVVEGQEQEGGEASKPPPNLERKPLEPYEVPTSGAFWMHDNRLADDGEADTCVLAHAYASERQS